MVGVVGAGIDTGIKGGVTGAEACEARTLLDAKKLGTLAVSVVSAEPDVDIWLSFLCAVLLTSEDPEGGPKSAG